MGQIDLWLDRKPVRVNHKQTFICAWSIPLIASKCRRSLCSVHYLLVNEIDGAAGVYVHKIHIDVLIEQLGTSGHGVWKTAFQLQHNHTISSRGIARNTSLLYLHWTRELHSPVVFALINSDTVWTPSLSLWA